VCILDDIFEDCRIFAINKLDFKKKMFRTLEFKHGNNLTVGDVSCPVVKTAHRLDCVSLFVEFSAFIGL
jgi:hypothetical protein